MRPTLGNVAYRVMALGVVYFVLAATLDVASNVSKLSQLSVSSRLGLGLGLGSGSGLGLGLGLGRSLPLTLSHPGCSP